MARLPVPGKDDGQWGDILNDYLSQAHEADGSIKDAGVVAQKYVLPASGIPKVDLSAGVQASLNNADAASLPTASQISDSTAVGRSVLTASDASAARAAIGAGTSNFDGTYSSLTGQPTIPVTSVNTKTGAVVISPDDLSDASTTNKFVTAAEKTKLSNLSGTNTGDQTSISGNAGTATVLATARTINGVPFDGSANITIADSTKVPTTTTVNGHALSSNVAITASDVGLGNVDNTSNASERAAVRTLTNARITSRVGATVSSATPSVDCGLYDQYNITSLATAISGFTITGTPTDGQKLLVRIKDNGTAQAITWGASFVSSGSAALLATTAISKTHTIGFIYDSAAAKWVCQAVDSVGY